MTGERLGSWDGFVDGPQMASGFGEREKCRSEEEERKKRGRREKEQEREKGGQERERERKLINLFENCL